MRCSVKVLLLVLGLLLLVGCVPGVGNYTTENPAGFLSGIWHGWIAPVMLVVGLFGDVRLYEPVNTGWWYDFGFYLAVLGGFGGLAMTRKGP